MSEVVEFLSLSNLLGQCSDHFHGRLFWPEGINKDPSVGLDGAVASPKYIFKNSKSLTNSKI
jgi:hypothetical protein